MGHVAVERDLSGAVHRVMAAFGDEDPATLVAMSMALLRYVDDLADVLGHTGTLSVEIHLRAHLDRGDVAKVRDKVTQFAGNAARLRPWRAPRIVIDDGSGQSSGRFVIAA
jgi:hypothetical protein